MGSSASRELAADGQPCRLTDLNDTLQSIVSDLMQEQMTETNIAERREEIEKEQKEQQQVQQGMNAAFAAAGAAGSSNSNNNTMTGDDHHHHHHHAASLSSSPGAQQQQQQQLQAEDPFPPVPVPALGIAVELRNKSMSAGGEQVETVHRVWVALTVPGVGLGDEGAKAAASAVSQAAHLELLDIGYNDIGAAGAQALCPALAASVAGKETLRFLRLTGNDLGVAGAKAVADMLAPRAAPPVQQQQQQQQHPSLLGVSKQNNNNNGPVTMISGVPYLEDLQLYNCGINDAGVHALVNGLRSHNFIRHINLAKNPTTRKSILMFTELAKRCSTLVNVHIDVAPSGSGNVGAGADVAVKDADYAALEEALEHNRAEEARRNQTRAVLAAKARRRDQQALDEARKAEVEAREERDRITSRVRELEAAQKQHEDDERRLAALEAEKEALAAARRKAQRAAESTEALDKAMAQAYAWRTKLGVSTGKAAIYRDGFALFTRQQFLDEHGMVCERMVEYNRNPTRLRACWCDPPDAAVPYARKLHYHCKYENASSSSDLLGSKGADLNQPSSGNGSAGGAGGSGGSGGKYTTSDLPKYLGCQGTGHICASVGSHAKALPNKTAAFFFSSQHPSFVEDDRRQQHHDDNHGWGS